MKLRLLRHVLSLVVPLALAHAAQPAKKSVPEPIAPIRAPFPMPQLQRPKFPARVVNIKDHGAIQGGMASNTEAFARAIKACADAGGGRVLVPAGRWLTGPIHLRSRIELHLAEGSEVIFSDRFEDYLPTVLVRTGGIDLYNYSPLIYARDCENVGITGPGKLNGNGAAWWPWKRNETKQSVAMAAKGVPVEQRVFGTPEAAIRPNFVVLHHCTNVLLEGFTIGSGPCWTIQPVYCENVIIRRLQILTDGPNNDGIDPDSCRNVLVEHCVFDTGDDCVVLKSGYNEDGWRVARPTENVVMRWCSSKRGHGGLVIGSEMSGDVRNVFMHDCTFEGTDHALRIKSRRDRGGVVENIWAENLKATNLKYDFVIMTMDYGADPNAPTKDRPPVFRNVHVRNLQGNGAPIALDLAGMGSSRIENVTFENLTLVAKQGVVARAMKNVTFRNVVVTPSTGPAFKLTDVADVLITGAKAPPASEVFLTLAGKNSRGVRIEASDLSGAKQPFTLAADVPPDAASVR